MNEPRYIIRSGDGYFVRFGPNGNQEMITDPVSATRMNTETTQSVIEILTANGFEAEPIILRHARIREIERSL